MIHMCVSQNQLSPAREAVRLHSAFRGTVAHSGGRTSNCATMKKQTRKIADLSGKRFGRLTVIRFAGKASYKSFLWTCKCDCGITKNVPSMCLNRTATPTRSCGCIKLERARTNAFKHGWYSHGRNTSEYNCWLAMKDRCGNPKSHAWDYYGGRGILVCEEWKNSFERFMLDMGQKPGPEYSIERKDNSGNYEPKNCIWATRSQQGNNKRNNRVIEIDGKKNTASNWCREFEIPPCNFFARISKGWSNEDALTKPIARKAEQATTPMPTRCCRHGCNDPLLEKNDSGLMVCPECGYSYGKP